MPAAGPVRTARRNAAAAPSGLIGIVYTPGLVCTAAVVVAILAATIGGRDRWLVPVTVAVTGACWVIGMMLAVLLERPIF